MKIIHFCPSEFLEKLEGKRKKISPVRHPGENPDYENMR